MADAAPRGFWHTFLSVFLTFVLVTIIGLAVALQVIPRMLGGTSLTVLTGSMQPTINPGDVIAVRDADPDEIRVGDIVTFQPVSGDPTLITHRVVGKGISPTEGIFFTTQGDANSAPDDQIVAAQLQGVYMYRVPYLGYLLQLGRDLGLIAVTAGVVLVVAALVLVLRPSRRRAPGDSDGDEPETGATTGVSQGGAPDAAGAPAPTDVPSDAGAPASPPLTRRDHRTRGSALVLVILAAAFSAPVLLPAGDVYALPLPGTAGADTALPSTPALRVDLVGPAVRLDWRGEMVYDQPDSIFGDRVVVPGDRIGRVIRIANPADSDQVLQAHLSRLAVAGDESFAGDLGLSWSVLGVSSGRTTRIATADTIGSDVTVSPGESVDVTVVLAYPSDVAVPAAQNHGAVPVAASQVQFDITITAEPTEQTSQSDEQFWAPRGRAARTRARVCVRQMTG